MAIEDLINSIQLDDGEEFEWFGPTDERLVSRTEKLLEYTCPPDLREFLLSYGGGGVLNEWVSGVGDEDKDNQCGYILADTAYYRETYGIPEEFIVLQRDPDDNEPYCISRLNNAIYCVGLHSREDSKIADTFSEFLKSFMFYRE